MASLSNKLAANKKFEFFSQAFGADKFAVVNMTGFESISKPFRFVLTLVSDDAGIDFDKVLQNAATFRIFAPNGASSTPYHGVIAEFDQLHQTDGYVFYRAVLVPRLWHLSLYQISEVYLNDQSIPQIIEKVLKGGRLTSADYEVKLSGSYRARSFVCQYQETHLDFISRWMEKEGMYFFFDHDGEKEKLLIADNRSMHPAQAVKVLYRPVDQKDTGVSEDSVQDFVCRQKPLPKQVVLRDYNYRKANVELKVTEPVFDNGIGEVNIYGENFRNEAEGQRYAKLRAEEILCGGKVFTGEATVVGLRSGYLMEMSRHYRDNFNGQYLVTEVHHEGSQAAALLAGIKTTYSEGQGGETIYRNTFRAIPAATQFRPERTTARPRVAGTMNATIDAAGSGPYAELDEYGQYKVQLPFDNTDKAAGKGSARIRMASPYSGSQYGMNFPLHKDAEVLLSFIDGNPDEPVILGAVPNSENPSVVSNKNPAESLITTAGGNQILMDDTKGKEVVYITSPYQNSALVIGNPEGRRSTVGRDGKDGAAGAKGDTGATGAAGAKGDAGATGATGPEAQKAPAPPYPGFWASTSGSSESVTFGTTNAIKVGYNNTLGLSIDNSVTASIANKFALGASATFSYGKDVAWKNGTSITLDDSEAISLKASGKLAGNKDVMISGGQAAPLAAATEAAKETVKKAVLLATGLNVAAGAAAGALINQGADLDDKGKAKFKDNSWGNWSARALGIVSGPATAFAINRVLSGLATTLAELTKPSLAFASNIKLATWGTEISSTDLPPLSQGRVILTPGNVTLNAGAPVLPILPALPDAPPTFPPAEALGSMIELTSTRVKLTNSLLLPPSSLELESAAATLATLNPAGEVKLTHFNSGHVTLASTGLTAASGVSELSLDFAAGAVLQGGPNAKVSVTSANILASVSPGSGLIVDATGGGIFSPGGNEIMVTPSMVVLKGMLIQLG